MISCVGEKRKTSKLECLIIGTQIGSPLLRDIHMKCPSDGNNIILYLLTLLYSLWL